MQYTSTHTQGDSYIQYHFINEDNAFTQHINVYNPDIEIENE